MLAGLRVFLRHAYPRVCVNVRALEFMTSACYACACKLYSHKCPCVYVCAGWMEAGGVAEGALPPGALVWPLINPFSGRRVPVIRPLQSSRLRPNSRNPKSTTQVGTQRQAHTFGLLRSLILMHSQNQSLQNNSSFTQLWVLSFSSYENILPNLMNVGERC